MTITIRIDGKQDCYDGVIIGNKRFNTGDPVRDFRQAVMYWANDHEDKVLEYDDSISEFICSGSRYVMDSADMLVRDYSNIVTN